MSDAPKDKKPAAAAPAKAAAKGGAPAKGAAGAKGAAKGTAKPVEKKDTPKKIKTRESRRAKKQERIAAAAKDPKKVEARKKEAEARKAKSKAAHEKLVAKQKWAAEFKKRVALARKNKQPVPKWTREDPALTLKKAQERPAKIAAKKAAAKKERAAKPKPAKEPRRVLKLTPLNQHFQTKFGFLFSEFIGKAREKKLTARHVKVYVNNPGHPLHGRVGFLRYYTGKHKCFVRLSHTLFKLPWGVLVRRKERFALLAAKIKRRNGRALFAYNQSIQKWKKAAAQAKAAGKAAPARPAAFKPRPSPAFTHKKLKARKGKKPLEFKARKPVDPNAPAPLHFVNVGRAVVTERVALLKKSIKAREAKRKALTPEQAKKLRGQHRRYPAHTPKPAKPAAAAAESAAAKPKQAAQAKKAATKA